MLIFAELREAWQTEPRAHRVAVVVMLVAAIVLRLLHLAQPMRYDEAVTYVYFARLPLPEAISTYTYPNNHLLHTLLVKGSVALFGNHPWAIRLPAFAAGVAIVPAAHVVARMLYGGTAALVATAVVASSGLLTLYATNARGYSIVVLAFLLLMIVAIRIQGVPRAGAMPDAETGTEAAAPGLWVAFAVVGAVGFWAIPVMLFPFGAVALWLALWALLANRPVELRRLGTALLITGMLTALAYAPVIARHGLSAIVRNRFVAPQSWIGFFDELPGALREALRSWGLGFPPVVSIVLLGCTFAALARHASVSRLRVNFGVAAFAWSAWLLVVTHRTPFPRVWLWVLPFAAAVAGAGFEVLLRRLPRAAALLERRVPIVAGALCIGLAVSVYASRAVFRSRDTGTYGDAELAARALRTIVARGDRVLAAIPTNGPLAYYLDASGVDPSVLTTPERMARRIVAVVDAREGQTLASVAGRSVVADTAAFVRDSAIVRLPGSVLVVFNRRDAATR